MKKDKILIEGIPSIIWGENSEKLYIHVHGKMSCKENAADFAEIAEHKGYQTLSFDLPDHGERKGEGRSCDVFNAVPELNTIADYAFSYWKEVYLFAGSIGAYFSLMAYFDREIKSCLFQSPIADMEYLVKQMMMWFDVSPERLEKEKLIDNPVDPLRWDYYQYIISHPVTKLDIATSILYGSLDNLQSYEAIKSFSDSFGCNLTVSEGSEHAFMSERDIAITKNWLAANI